MLRFVSLAEQLIVRVLMALLLVAIILGTFALGRVLVLEILEPPLLLLDVGKLFEAFGLFVVVLIGLELLKSMALFVIEERVEPRLVVEVAIIALCNKVITLDLAHTAGLSLVGIAAIFVGLAATYFVVQRSDRAVAEYEHQRTAEWHAAQAAKQRSH
jgi:uncharacterized membrane protein (DUF373 family)